jgi:hypothetical protein
VLQHLRFHLGRSAPAKLALGLEALGKPFLWVVMADGWAPPEGWEERVASVFSWSRLARYAALRGLL